MRISDWSSDVCSSDLPAALHQVRRQDLLGILDRAVVIPDAFRIDHHGRTQLAAVAAAGLVDPHPLEAELLHPRLQVVAQPRSEARRVGKECVSTCRSRWSQYHSITNHTYY